MYTYTCTASQPVFRNSINYHTETYTNQNTLCTEKKLLQFAYKHYDLSTITKYIIIKQCKTNTLYTKVYFST